MSLFPELGHPYNEQSEERWQDDWLQLGVHDHSQSDPKEDSSVKDRLADHVANVQMDTSNNEPETSEEDDDKEVLTKADKKVLKEVKRRHREANRFLIHIAMQMGCDLKEKSIKKRLSEYASPRLIDDLLSQDRVRQECATRSILVHRPTNPTILSIQKLEAESTLLVYQDWTRDDVIDRLFDVMEVAPIEDLRLCWLDSISKSLRPDAYAMLRSIDRSKQESAIKILLGLTRKGEFWIKEKTKKLASSSRF